MKYFTVKKGIKIADKSFYPCICYDLTEYFRLNIEKLEKEGRANIYDEPVFFQNGKMIEKKKQKTEKKKAPKKQKVEKIEEPTEKVEEPVIEVGSLVEEPEVVDETEGF